MINIDAINTNYRTPEQEYVQHLLQQAVISNDDKEVIRSSALQWATHVRSHKDNSSIVAQLMQQYNLSSTQGLTLMCLAEALLRIPDTATATMLLCDKIPQGEWENLITKGDSLLSKASAFALRIASSLLKPLNQDSGTFLETINKFVGQCSEPVIREAIRFAMKLMAQQFIVGSNIHDAVKNSTATEAKGYLHSYDMLGEAAVTFQDAQRYQQAYIDAIHALGMYANADNIHHNPSISVKLSALYPRYSFTHSKQAVAFVSTKIIELGQLCKAYNICMTIDAEESYVLQLSLEIINNALRAPQLANWQGLGLAVQAYQKRAVTLIDELINTAKETGNHLHIRLVKGAYWDSEIKYAQVNGLSEYPVFTRKPYTDLSYLVCAQKMLHNRQYIYPAFATHNAYTIATILRLAGSDTKNFEFQRLHGMGHEVYDQILTSANEAVNCRIYAPVGTHNDLLPYLVRRMLENGANSSFVYRLKDPLIEIEELLRDPITFVTQTNGASHPKIPLPIDIYTNRKNSFSFDLSNNQDLDCIQNSIANLPQLCGGPIINGLLVENDVIDTHSPSDQQVIGTIRKASAENVEQAFHIAQQYFPIWNKTCANIRADALNKMALLLEENCAYLMGICTKEAGKTIPDALAEVREAIDFCRYYAAEHQENFASPVSFSGPTGEANSMSMHGRGVFVCISPWNFPLAIFIGQIAAALVCGNTVIAKPASSTVLIATEAVRLFHKAGIPIQALHLLPGDSSVIGNSLLAHQFVAGVAMTGSTETAQAMYQTLAQKSGPIVPFIAETGGQNVMIVDSSALLEQVTKDVMASAFQSAGQRCSALRVLCLQEEIADKAIDMIHGAMETLVMGQPQQLSTDVGPVITKRAQTQLIKYTDTMKNSTQLIYQQPISEECADGFFVAPTAFEITNFDQLNGEQFGPILHIIRFKANAMDELINNINSMGYGLTAGIHSRIQKTIDKIISGLRVGNIYVNRNMIGAVVGVQPFGGEGLSGTGPKAGGPHYLLRFMTEKTVSTNLTAQGGNTSLMMLDL